jgi:hypothetical protein
MIHAGIESRKKAREYCNITDVENEVNAIRAIDQKG